MAKDKEVLLPSKGEQLLNAFGSILWPHDSNFSNVVTMVEFSFF